MIHDFWAITKVKLQKNLWDLQSIVLPKLSTRFIFQRVMVTRKISLCRSISGRLASVTRSRIETSEFWRYPVCIKCTNKNASVGTIFHEYYLQAYIPIVLPVDASGPEFALRKLYAGFEPEPLRVLHEIGDLEFKLPNVKHRINARCRVHWTHRRVAWLISAGPNRRKRVGLERYLKHTGSILHLHPRSYGSFSKLRNVQIYEFYEFITL